MTDDEATGPVVLRWPAEQHKAAQLAAQGIPRLLLLDADSEPPLCLDPLADWARMPIDGRDIDARLLVLRERSRRRPPAALPELDQSGRLLRNGRWVALARIEERLAAAMLERFGEVVTDGELLARAWPEGESSPAALRVQVMRLRRRIRALGLEVRTVRGRGYLLQLSEQSAWSASATLDSDR